MENAGIRLFEALVEEYAPEPSDAFVFVVGAGNNAGDCLVLARQAWNLGFRNLAIVRVKDELKGLSLRWHEVAVKLGIPSFSFAAEREASLTLIRGCSILLDGITGLGIEGPLKGVAADFIAALKEIRGPRVVAVDSPSGIGDAFRPGFPAVQADLTLTVAPAKTALYLPAARPFCGTNPAGSHRLSAGSRGCRPGYGSYGPKRGREADLSLPAAVLQKPAGTPGCIRGFCRNRRSVPAGNRGRRQGRGRAGDAVCRSGYLPRGSGSGPKRDGPAWTVEDGVSGVRCGSCVIGPGWGADDGRSGQLSMLLEHFERGSCRCRRTEPSGPGETGAERRLGADSPPRRVRAPSGYDCRGGPRGPGGGRPGAAERLRGGGAAEGPCQLRRLSRHRDRRHRRNEPAYGNRRQRRTSWPVLWGGCWRNREPPPSTRRLWARFCIRRPGRICAQETGLFTADDLMPVLSRLTAGLRHAGT